MDSAEILRMEGISKRFPAAFGWVDVLHCVNITVSQGDFLVVTGPSGSGKTTFLHLAALMDHPTDGRLFFEGEDISGFDDKQMTNLRKYKIGMVFQNYHLLPYRTVLDNVLFRFRYLDLERKKVIRLAHQALDVLDLNHISNRAVRLLSAGEMQRVAFARAIVLEPRLLVADEPTGNLDERSTGSVMDCFKNLNHLGITVLLVTHNLALLKYASRHLVCANGTIGN